MKGGTHLAGFRRALTRTLKKYAEDNKMLEKAKVEISGDDFREGLTAVISIKVAEPQFEGQTKTKLASADATKAVFTVTGDQLQLYFDRNVEVLKGVIGCAEKICKDPQGRRKKQRPTCSPSPSFPLTATENWQTAKAVTLLSVRSSS